MGGFVISLVSGLTYGMILFLVASGLTLIFGVLRVLNFVHGAMVMLGAYVAASFVGPGVPSLAKFLLAVLVAAIVTGLLGLLVEVLLVRRIYQRDTLDQLILMFGLVFLFVGGVVALWGVDIRSVSAPDELRGPISLAGRAFPAYYALPWAATLGVVGALWWLFKRSKAGWSIRAAAENREVSQLAGVDPSRIYTAVYVLGSVLAGVAGALYAPMISISTAIPDTLILDAFIIVVIGGLGSIAGSFVGAMLLGVLNAVSAQFLPELSTALPFLLMILVIAVRPTGLFGVVQREI